MHVKKQTIIMHQLGFFSVFMLEKRCSMFELFSICSLKKLFINNPESGC